MVFESVTVFDIVIHRQIYRFIYRFLFLNQLTLELSVMVMSHVDFSAHLHLSNISDQFFPFKNCFLFLLENVRMSFVSKCKMQCIQLQDTYILHSFLNVLNAFGYKYSEFVAEMLM